MSNQSIQLTSVIPLECAGKRLDQSLAQLFPEHSRSRLKEWIEKGQVLIDGTIKRPKDKVVGGEHIQIQAEQEIFNEAWGPEALPLDIIYEDEYIAVINKPMDLVVHPAAGHQQGTLVNALLHHIPCLVSLPRAGIVHRLDKDTTGLLVVAKTMEAHTKLVATLQAREMVRHYEAIVQGMLLAGGTVDAPIGRHPHDRKKMAVSERGKEAVTHYRVLQKFTAHTHLQVQLETGRTHQIRVHMLHLNYPIVGDKTYGGRQRVPPKASESLLLALRTFPRQALHAKKLGFNHPVTGEYMEWESPIPTDMSELLSSLRQSMP
jgi:23S rRNA pseudouridine1911/1915/1917 synthase